MESEGRQCSCYCSQGFVLSFKSPLMRPIGISVVQRAKLDNRSVPCSKPGISFFGFKRGPRVAREAYRSTGPHGVPMSLAGCQEESPIVSFLKKQRWEGLLETSLIFLPVRYVSAISLHPRGRNRRANLGAACHWGVGMRRYRPSLSVLST